MKVKKPVICIATALLGALVFYIGTLHNKDSVSKHLATPNVDLHAGRLLAEKYCISCHQFPEPALLPKAIWQTSVLPAMGLFLGVVKHSVAFDSIGKEFFSPKPLLSNEEWEELQKFYVGSAPEKLPGQSKRPLITLSLPYFSIVKPVDDQLFGKIELASYVKIIDEGKSRLLVNDGFSNNLFKLDENLKILSTIKMPGTLVDIDFKSNPYRATFIGQNYMANQLKDGTIDNISFQESRSIPSNSSIFKALGRPLKSMGYDINGDGLKDEIIAEFGNLKGRLSWKEATRMGHYIDHILKNTPGAIDFKIFDYNHDGLPDIWALFAQADEGIFLFTNKGNGQFETSRILAFPPSYGSSSFQLLDLNQDGFKDIIYTCGDNADLSQVLKPYHGIYIYINDGKNRFSKKYFYPLNGCYKAIAEDFDGDGDLDIAAISAFPAAITPWEAFVYLEKQSDFKYKPFTLPEGTNFQKGLTMDCGDFNGDGKTDILIGNKFYTSSKDTYKEPLFILLKNISPTKAHQLTNED